MVDGVALREDDEDAGDGGDEHADRALEDVAETASKTIDEPNRAIVCGECGHEVTNSDHRTGRDGGFEHSFANPAGIVFQIGCFEEASGCGPIGEASSEFSWFPGYTWRVGLCRECRRHLGWLFESSDDDFWGLILPRIEGGGET